MRPEVRWRFPWRSSATIASGLATSTAHLTLVQESSRSVLQNPYARQRERRLSETNGRACPTCLSEKNESLDCAVPIATFTALCSTSDTSTLSVSFYLTRFSSAASSIVFHLRMLSSCHTHAFFSNPFSCLASHLSLFNLRISKRARFVLSSP